MIRMTIVKWLAAGALALSVPAIGMARHTGTVADAAMTSVDSTKTLASGSASVTKTRHHKKNLSHTRSHTKHKALHSHHHKAKKLTTSKKHVAS